MNVEEKQQSALQRNIQRELEWIRQNAKGQQKKGKVYFSSFQFINFKFNKFI